MLARHVDRAYTVIYADGTHLWLESFTGQDFKDPTSQMVRVEKRAIVDLADLSGNEFVDESTIEPSKLVISPDGRTITESFINAGGARIINVFKRQK